MDGNAEKKIRDLFQNTVELPNDTLNESIYSYIKKAERRRNIFTLSYLSILILGSITALVPVVSSLLQSFAKSGFYDYASLLLSDRGALTIYWREFSLTLAEALPVANIVATLALFLICMLSINFFVRKIKRSLLLTA
jgi:hypothetical protein